MYDKKIAEEIIIELGQLWGKYCDAFDSPVYGSYVLQHLTKAQKLIWDEITEQEAKERHVQQ